MHIHIVNPELCEAGGLGGGELIEGLYVTLK